MGLLNYCSQPIFIEQLLSAGCYTVLVLRCRDRDSAPPSEEPSVWREHVRVHGESEITLISAFIEVSTEGRASKKKGKARICLLGGWE